MRGPAAWTACVAASAMVLSGCGPRSRPAGGTADSLAVPTTVSAAGDSIRESPPSGDSVHPHQAVAAPTGALSFTGRVETIGTPPATAVGVRDENGEIRRLEGPLAEEVGHLVGATVAVRGMEGERGPVQSVRIDDYEVVMVDGERPYVGIVRLADGRVWLEGTQRLVLSGAESSLQGLRGAKVYVLGTRVADTVTVASFGLIRSAP